MVVSEYYVRFLLFGESKFQRIPLVSFNVLLGFEVFLLSKYVMDSNDRFVPSQIRLWIYLLKYIHLQIMWHDMMIWYDMTGSSLALPKSTWDLMKLAWSCSRQTDRQKKVVLCWLNGCYRNKNAGSARKTRNPFILPFLQSVKWWCWARHFEKYATSWSF